MGHVRADQASLAGHVTSVHPVIMVTQNAQHVAVMWQERIRHSATRQWECVTVNTMGSVCAR